MVSTEQAALSCTHSSEPGRAQATFGEVSGTGWDGWGLLCRAKSWTSMIIVGPLHNILCFCDSVATFSYNTQDRPSCKTIREFTLPSNRARTSRVLGQHGPAVTSTIPASDLCSFCLPADHQGSASRVMYLQIFHIFKNLRCEKITAVFLQTILEH